MIHIMKKELTLSAALFTYFSLIFGLMFFLPGYPVLCSAFFITLGIFKSFQNAREANDFVFSALLPVAKSDVVKGKYLFSCFIELSGLLVMAFCTIIRMTVFKDALVYRSNALMNANLYALGAALVIFGLFNLIFIDGFFKTAYKFNCFVVYIIIAFLTLGMFEALHFVPGMEFLNAFGFDHIGIQLGLLAAGAVIYLLLTLISYKHSIVRFEKIDL